MPGSGPTRTGRNTDFIRENGDLQTPRQRNLLQALRSLKSIPDYMHPLPQPGCVSPNDRFRHYLAADHGFCEGPLSSSRGIGSPHPYRIAGKQGIGVLAWQRLAERGIARDPPPHQLAVFSCYGPLPAHTPDKSRISASVTISVIGSADDGSKPSA